MKMSILCMVCSIPTILIFAIFLNAAFGQTAQELLVSLVTTMAVVIAVLVLTPAVLQRFSRDVKTN